MVIWGLPPMSLVWDMSINAWVIIGVSFTYVSAAHYTGVIMSLIVSQITSLTTVYSPVCSGTNQMNSPHKGPVTRKVFPFDYAIMRNQK